MPADAAPERSARLSKGHPKYARTYTLLDELLPERVHFRAPPSERLPVSLHANGNLLNNFRLIWVIQPPAQKYSAFHRPQISGSFRAVPSRQEGRIARRHERGTGCGGRRQRQARSVFAGRLSVSGHGAQDDRRCGVRQNRVVLASVAGVKLPVANSIQPDRSAIKPAAMEAKGIRLQGELGISRQTIAQGMPACSGCTCMLVCALPRAHCTRDRGCSKHPAFPAPSRWRERLMQTSGAGAARTPTHIPLSSPAKAHAGDPVFQRRNDRIEKPRRTRCPAFAGHDSQGSGEVSDPHGEECGNAVRPRTMLASPIEP